MKSEFWKEIIESTGEENGQKLPFFSLAPMEAVTDVVFRHVVSKAARPDVIIPNSQILQALLAQKEFIAHAAA